MRKRVFGKKLSMERATREALFVFLVENLITNKKIVTTKAKAKAVIPFVDRLLTIAKKETLASKREVLKRLRGNKKVAAILWKDLSPIFSDRAGGFTRIVALGGRKGDLSEMVRFELVDYLPVLLHF